MAVSLAACAQRMNLAGFRAADGGLVGEPPVEVGLLAAAEGEVVRVQPVQERNGAAGRVMRDCCRVAGWPLLRLASEPAAPRLLVVVGQEPFHSASGTAMPVRLSSARRARVGGRVPLPAPSPTTRANAASP